MSEVKSNFSIKFAIYAKETVNLSGYVRLSTKKSKRLLLEIEKANEPPASKSMATMYQEFLDINLRKKVQKRPNLISKGSVESVFSGVSTSGVALSFVEKNISEMSLRSPLILNKKLKDASKALDYKISQAQGAKAQFLSERKEKYMASLRKHDISKQKAEEVMNSCMEGIIGVGRVRAWVIMIKLLQIANKMMADVAKFKHDQQAKKNREKHSQIIQKKLKPILGWLVKDRAKQNLQIISQTLRFHASIAQCHQVKQAEQLLGLAFREFSQKILLRNLMFNRMSYFIKIQNKWKNFIRNKKRMRLKFAKSIEYVYGKISKSDELCASNLLREVRYFNSKCRDQLFDLFFNDGLKGYLANRLEHMAKSAMLLNVDDYFHEASEDQRTAAEARKEAGAYKVIRERNTLGTHINGLALVIYRSYLIAADPSVVDVKFKKFKANVTSKRPAANIVPISLVKIRSFPTITTFVQTHSRSELYGLILENHEMGVFSRQIEQVGKLDVDYIKSTSPVKKAKGKALVLNPAELEEERQQEQILKQHAEKSAGFRRIMNLLAREFRDTFELEVPDEMFVTTVMTSLSYFADKMKQQRLELELSSPLMSPSKSVLH